MVRYVADTHCVIWYLYADSRLSVNARTTVERVAASGDQVAFSLITTVWNQTGRTRYTAGPLPSWSDAP